MANILKWINEINSFILFTVVLIINLMMALFLNLLEVDFEENPLKGYPIYIIFILVVIISPIIETLLFNIIPIKLLQKVKYLKDKNFIVILIASVVFALTHTYSIAYVLMTYIGAVSLNTFYVITEQKKNSVVAGILTMLLHSVYNLIGFLLIEVFHVL